MTAPITAPTSATKATIITNLDASPIVRATAGGSANGVFGGGIVQRMQSTVTLAANASSTIIRFLRVPSVAVVQNVSILLDATEATFEFCLGLWWSDANDGTPLLQQGNLTAISSAFFAYEFIGTGSGIYSYPALSTGAMSAPSSASGVPLPPDFFGLTFGNAAGAMTDGQYLPSQSGYPLWLAVGNSINAVAGTAVGASTSSTNSYPYTVVAGTGGSLWTWGSDPGGFFDICAQPAAGALSGTAKMTVRADVILPAA